MNRYEFTHLQHEDRMAARRRILTAPIASTAALWCVLAVAQPLLYEGPGLGLVEYGSLREVSDEHAAAHGDQGGAAYESLRRCGWIGGRKDGVGGAARSVGEWEGGG